MTSSPPIWIKNVTLLNLPSKILAPGVPEHLVDDFMLPYSSSKDKNGKNVGLGLAIVTRIIKEHDGHFSYEPNKPTGATFHFWIPTPTPDQIERAKSLEEPPLFFLDDDWFK